MAILQIRRGAGTTALADGELGFNTNSKNLFIGTSSGNLNIGRPIEILSQSQYDALTTKDANTIYIISSSDAVVTTSVLTTELNKKQNSITGGASTITNTNLTSSRALISNSSGKVDVSAVTSTELGYLDGVTSAIQTQLNGKQATITGGISNLVNSNLTASRALVSNSSGKVDVSAVTSTELGYLDGVTSTIQTQLDNRLDMTTKGINIPDNSDLNNYTTPGRYYVAASANAATIANVPSTKSGFTMFVYEAYNSIAPIQILYNSRGICYTRAAQSITDGIWYDWHLCGQGAEKIYDGSMSQNSTGSAILPFIPSFYILAAKSGSYWYTAAVPGKTVQNTAGVGTSAGLTDSARFIVYLAANTAWHQFSITFTDSTNTTKLTKTGSGTLSVLLFAYP